MADLTSDEVDMVTSWDNAAELTKSREDWVMLHGRLNLSPIVVSAG
jgi:hypothetical protein